MPPALRRGFPVIGGFMPPALRRGFSTIFFSAKPTLIPFALRSEPALNAVEGVNSVEGPAPASCDASRGGGRLNHQSGANSRSKVLIAPDVLPS
jgi:hypothetical protein